MKIHIVFHSQKLRVAFLVALCALIGLLASLTVTVRAETPSLPEELKRPGDSKMVLLDFYSAFCGTCQMMEPHLKALEAKTTRDVRFERIDLTTPEGEKYMNLFSIQGTPTYVLFNAQGTPIYRMQDLITPLVLEKQVLRLTGQLKQTSIPTGVGLPLAESSPAQKLDQMILVSFENEECNECKAMTPYLQGFEMTGQQGLHIVHLDTATPSGKKLMDSLNIKALPAYVLFDNNGTPQADSRGELFRMTGTIKPRVLWDVIRLFGQPGV
jgi:thiol:disulfide interchange protein